MWLLSNNAYFLNYQFAYALFIFYASILDNKEYILYKDLILI